MAGAPRPRPLTTVWSPATLAGALSSCSASPPAATVNGQVITQGQLDQWLEAGPRARPMSRPSRQPVRRSRSEAASQGQQQPAFTSRAPAPAPATSAWCGRPGGSASWCSASALHQYLERQGEAPVRARGGDGVGERVRRQPAGVATAPGRAALGGGRAGRRARSHRAEVLRAWPVTRQLYKDDSSYFWTQVCLTDGGRDRCRPGRQASTWPPAASRPTRSPPSSAAR